MRLYIATLESQTREGVRVKMVVHATNKKVAIAMAQAHRTSWTVLDISHAAGPRCIAFLDELPDDPTDA